MESPSATSLSLLRRVREKDQGAWQRLVTIYGPIVCQICRKSGFTEQDAEDVTQDVFLGVSQSLHNFRKERSDDTFRGWLKQIAKRRMVDWIRKNAGKTTAAGGSTANLLISQLPENIDQEWNPDEVQHQAYFRALELMKSDFQEATWQAFWLSIVEGQSTAEVADKLNMKPAAVRKARSRVRQRLVEELGDLLDIPNAH